jgi:hypothetical protein
MARNRFPLTDPMNPGTALVAALATRWHRGWHRGWHRRWLPGWLTRWHRGWFSRARARVRAGAGTGAGTVLPLPPHASGTKTESGRLHHRSTTRPAPRTERTAWRASQNGGRRPSPSRNGPGRFFVVSRGGRLDQADAHAAWPGAPFARSGPRRRLGEAADRQRASGAWRADDTLGLPFPGRPIRLERAHQRSGPVVGLSSVPL